MSPLDQIPQPWRDAMENAGAYSLRDLSDKAGVGTSTVSNLVYGRSVTSEPTMQAVADSLRLSVTTVREWAATARGEAQPFELPPEANRLTRREREAVLAVVRAMLDPAGQDAVESTTGSGKTESVAEVVDLARPSLPDFSQLAARRGESEGRRLVEQQDNDANNP